MSDADVQMKAYYAARAPYYDTVYERPERRIDIATINQHLAQRCASRSVLEIACGTGYWTQTIARVASRLLATDATAEPLAFARLRPHAQNVLFVQADAFAPPACPGAFDMAFAGLWLSHVPIERRHAFFAALHAALSPGARVVLIDNSLAQCRDLPIAETDANGNTFQHRALRDGSVHRVLKNFPDERQLRDLVDGSAQKMSYRLLTHFWLFEYVLAPATTRRGSRQPV